MTLRKEIRLKDRTHTVAKIKIEQVREVYKVDSGQEYKHKTYMVDIDHGHTRVQFSVRNPVQLWSQIMSEVYL